MITLTNLKELQLGHNALTGSIPGVFSNLINLTLLTAANNYLTGVIPIGFCTFTQTLNINVDVNHISGYPYCLPSNVQINGISTVYTSSPTVSPTTTIQPTVSHEPSASPSGLFQYLHLI